MNDDTQVELGELLETPHARAIGMRLETTPDGKPLFRLPLSGMEAATGSWLVRSLTVWYWQSMNMAPLRN